MNKHTGSVFGQNTFYMVPRCRTYYPVGLFDPDYETIVTHFPIALCTCSKPEVFILRDRLNA